MKQIKFILFALTLGATSLMISSCNSDECKDKDCGTTGVCQDGTCICDAGYELDAVSGKCTVESRAKLLGSYTFTDACTSGTYTGNATAANASAVTSIVFSNFAGTTASATGTINGNQITIPNGSLGAYTISGVTGTVSGTTSITITWNYTLKDSNNNTDVCSSTWVKL